MYKSLYLSIKIKNPINFEILYGEPQNTLNKIETKKNKLAMLSNYQKLIEIYDDIDTCMVRPPWHEGIKSGFISTSWHELMKHTKWNIFCFIKQKCRLMWCEVKWRERWK